MSIPTGIWKGTTIHIRKTGVNCWMIETVSFEEGKRILDTCPGSILLDVRTEDEYAVGHAAGAKLLPLDEMEEADVMEILPDLSAPVLLYCRTGRRASLAAAKLDDLGYTKIYNLGGLNGWPYGMEYGVLP